MTDFEVGQQALFGSNNIIDSRRMRDMHDHLRVQFIKDTEQQALRAMVAEAARYGIDEADVLHHAQIEWRCEVRAYLVVKEVPDAEPTAAELP